ncbi:MAG: hypothetical protein ABEI75_03730 [Halobaculum sp.]
MDRPPLSVEADLTLTVAGRECRIWSEDDVVVVNAPSFAVARRLARGLDTIPGAQGRLIEQLVATDVTVEVRVRRATVARLGGGVQPSRVARAAGLDGRLDLRGVVTAAWRRLL